jgi:hypothetical protein
MRRLFRVIALVCVGTALVTCLTGPASVAAAQATTTCSEPREYTEAGLSITMTVCGEATGPVQSRNLYEWRIVATLNITVSDSRGYDEGLVGCELGSLVVSSTTAPRQPPLGSCLSIVNAGQITQNVGSIDLFAGPAEPDWRVTSTLRFASNGGEVRMLSVRHDIPLPAGE